MHSREEQQAKKKKKRKRKLDCHNWIVIKQPEAPDRAHKPQQQLMLADKKEAEGNYVPSFC